jgi:hypothetical protein
MTHCAPKNSLDFKSLFCCIIPVHNDPIIYGYARVSTDGQSVDAQVKQLRAAGCEKIFRETASGASPTGRSCAAHWTTSARGDVLMVTRLDRHSGGSFYCGIVGRFDYRLL